MTRKQLNVLKNKWQKRLRLMDWDIEINSLRQSDMMIQGNIGEVSCG